jgi:hypothetical protein
MVAGAKGAPAAEKRRLKPLMPRRRRGVSQSKRRTPGRAGEETEEGRSWRSASIKRKTAGDSREIEKHSTASFHTHLKSATSRPAGAAIVPVRQRGRDDSIVLVVVLIIIILVQVWRGAVRAATRVELCVWLDLCLGIRVCTRVEGKDVTLEVGLAAERRRAAGAHIRPLLEVDALCVALEVGLEAEGVGAAGRRAGVRPPPLMHHLHVLLPHALAAEGRRAQRACVRLWQRARRLLMLLQHRRRRAGAVCYVAACGRGGRGVGRVRATEVSVSACVEKARRRRDGGAAFERNAPRVAWSCVANPQRAHWAGEYMSCARRSERMRREEGSQKARAKALPSAQT